ncbi:glucokinase [Aquabacterium sp. OR-4]|uniref:glucokinase n=1 Tax=Aquabacterium sp. OR-4 TaxID=2978127 RepID=UPI0021B4D40C|nr:glucokinase [Aquabacterium sp. OR-4]MDT7834734.1 glucokinase [Aquabacterium sp. OR-4]
MPRRARTDLPYPRLVGHVDGSEAHFALVPAEGQPLEAVARLACAAHATLDDAVQAYLATLSGPPPRAAALGLATAVTGDRVRMTNHGWAFSTRELRRALALDELLVINDFSALALALPLLQPSALRAVGVGAGVPGAPVALIGPCTGLGVSGLLPSLDGRLPVPLGGEGGHASLSAQDADEAAVLALLQRRFGHVSAERALSVPGLLNLAQAVAQLRGEPCAADQPDEVLQAGLAGNDAVCLQALQLFASLLGSTAGNLALTLGARGGVYLGGPLVPRLGRWLDRSLFRERFEGKGRLRAYLRAIPTWVLSPGPLPGLMGAARALTLLSPASPLTTAGAARRGPRGSRRATATVLQTLPPLAAPAEAGLPALPAQD